MGIIIRNLSKAYGDKKVLCALNAEMPDTDMEPSWLIRCRETSCCD